MGIINQKEYNSLIINRIGFMSSLFFILDFIEGLY